MPAIRTITDGSAQTEDPDSFDFHNGAVGAQAAFRRLGRITVIMVAVHVNNRCIGETGQEGQIFRGEIPCRENQIHTLKRLPAEISPEPGRGFIR